MAAGRIERTLTRARNGEGSRHLPGSSDPARLPPDKPRPFPRRAGLIDPARGRSRRSGECPAAERKYTPTRAACQAPDGDLRPVLQSCPRCTSPIPPLHQGLITERHGARRRRLVLGSWCHFCETWWVLVVGAPRRGPGQVWVAGPRRATPVESAMADRAIFERRGLVAPIEGAA